MNQETTRRREFLAELKNKSGGEGRLTIGFTCIADFRSFIGQEYIAGICKACEDYDINFINMSQAIKYSLFDEADFISHYLKKFRFMHRPLLDGLITWASSLATYIDDEEIIKRFSSLSPLPMVDIGYLDIPGVTALRIDNECSMHLIVEHLARKHSFKRIAFMGTNASHPHTERLNYFLSAMESLKIECGESSIFMAKNLDEAEIVRTAEEFCQSCLIGKREGERTEAVVTSSDIIASTLVSVLKKHGLKVPDDVAVTGFNNQYNGITCSPPITTIDLEYFKRGYLAVEILINKIMDGSGGGRTIKVPTSLVVRESCGCFESEIVEVADILKRPPELSDDATEEEARAFLAERINSIFFRESHESKENLEEAIFEDLYTARSPAKTLCWFRSHLGTERRGQFREREIQRKITRLQTCMLALAGSNEKQRQRMENIAGQLRLLCSIASEYENKARNESPYTFNNITQAAIHFASVTTGSQLKSALKTHLQELGIPGIILSLSDNMTTDLESSNVELILPEPSALDEHRLPCRIMDERNFPKSLFPKKGRYSVVLEILNYNERYFGFSFMQMKSKNMALYDSIRLLLCHSLYEIYMKEGRTKKHVMQLDTKRIEGILESPGGTEGMAGTSSVTLKQISSYMLEHIGEKTNLDKMSRELGLNKTKLIRQTKAFTGYTVQTLHEKLKMQLAKELILDGRLSLAEIAERLGFQNENYFSKVFKKNTGESPRSWAKKQS